MSDQGEPQIMFRYMGWGLEWIERQSLYWLLHVGTDVLDEDGLTKRLKEIVSQLGPSACENFTIKDRAITGMSRGSIRVYRVKGSPFDTYVVLSAENNSLLWCEIHVHSVDVNEVAILEVFDRPDFSPVHIYIVECLPGLRRFASAPPQEHAFAAGAETYGVACVCTSFDSHRSADHSHAPGEPESGAFIDPLESHGPRYADEVCFHGEIARMETMSFQGSTIMRYDVDLDFGKHGSFRLPVYVPSAAVHERYYDEPYQIGEFVQGIGALQVCCHSNHSVRKE